MEICRRKKSFKVENQRNSRRIPRSVGLKSDEKPKKREKEREREREREREEEEEEEEENKR